MDPIEISHDKSRLDLEVIHGFLAQSDWAKGRSKDLVRKCIDGSFCIGAYSGGRQIGFVRAVTDATLFGYIFDVFVLEGHRGRGAGRLLMQALLQHPELAGVKWMLRTSSAGPLYVKLGFNPLESAEGLYIRKPGPATG